MISDNLVNQKNTKLINKNLSDFNYKIIVLDDDPTGTQTIKDLPVYTEWTEKWIEDGFLQKNDMFYILTNSRALNEKETVKLHKEISQNIEKVANKLNEDYLIISRGDSTLRGHFYLEPKVISESATQPFDGVFYLPQFFEGNRYTYNGIHYLKENQKYIPVVQSEFSNDTTFGYSSETMFDFIEEKSEGEIKSSEVSYISLEMLREKKEKEIFTVFERLENFSAVVVDALNDSDMDYFASCLINFLKGNKKKLIFRTAASFVKAMCVTPGEIINLNKFSSNKNGGLIIVGSHVKKSSEQLSYLINNTNIRPFEFDVKEIIKDNLEEYINTLITKVEYEIVNGNSVVVYTSRDVIKTEDINNNLSISTNISNSLVNIVKNISIKPKFIIAKGGITSSDVATKGLNIKKAEVIGQVTKGVPVWLTGDEAKYPKMPYVIFPGNVGEKETLAQVYKMNN
ncbi:four-carbon acid sugar kinase family protein [Staphylococcus haemolyticus]|uniref:four-carbon acid sugar kinase family protein n=1 Tax=Staphylococcus haemolyticus TaxID=1283 RepID=UPI00255495B6|nr:four-carbon acid sugar kinase family protein [Staphylococcus haemolyticus]